MDPNCLFCKIAARKIPGKIVFENESVVAFEDIAPVAPTHVIVIPREHFASTLEVDASRHAVVGELVQVAAQLARARGFAEDGYRLVFNTNAAAGQSVLHLHLHLLGGRTFRWPPG
jgi:histidine triad (HIT) family protein